MKYRIKKGYRLDALGRPSNTYIVERRKWFLWISLREFITRSSAESDIKDRINEQVGNDYG